MLLPVPLPAQAEDQHPEGEQGVGHQVDQTDPVEQRQQARRLCGRDAVAGEGHQGDLDRQDHHRGEVEQRGQQAARRAQAAEHAPAGGGGPRLARGRQLQRAREDQEQVQGQRRQDAAGDLLDGVEQPAGGVRETRRGEQVDHRRGQAPEVEQHGLGTALPEDRVDADQQVEAADERQDQVRPVDRQRRAPVGGLDQLAGAHDEQGRLRGRAQGAAEVRRLAAGRHQDLVADLDAEAARAAGESLLDHGHRPAAARAHGLEPQRLEGVERPDEAHHAQGRHRDGGDQSDRERTAKTAASCRAHRRQRTPITRKRTICATESES